MSFANIFFQSLTYFHKMIEGRKAREALFLEHQRAQVTLDLIGDSVITVNCRGQVDYLNPLAEELIDATASQAHGKSLEEKALLQDSRNLELIVQTSIAPLRDIRNRIFGTVLVLRDISPLRAPASQLSYQATHDALTGLINRYEFEVRLRKALYAIWIWTNLR